MQNRQNHTGLDQNPLSEYAHYTEVPQHFPGLITPNRIQWMIRNRFENGLNQHVLRIGKTLYVHLPSFAAAKRDQIRDGTPRRQFNRTGAPNGSMCW